MMTSLAVVDFEIEIDPSDPARLHGRCPTIDGVVYHVESRDGTVEGDWNPVAELRGTGEWMEFRLPESLFSGEAHYFRVRTD